VIIERSLSVEGLTGIARSRPRRARDASEQLTRSRSPTRTEPRRGRLPPWLVYGRLVVGRAGGVHVFCCLVMARPAHAIRFRCEIVALSRLVTVCLGWALTLHRLLLWPWPAYQEGRPARSPRWRALSLQAPPYRPTPLRPPTRFPVTRHEGGDYGHWTDTISRLQPMARELSVNFRIFLEKLVTPA
jgi:hypothetical protein